MSLAPRPESAPDLFQWPSGIVLQIQSTRFPKSLQHELGALRGLAGTPDAADARIVFCRQSKEMPVEGEPLRGRYKGVPWQIACQQGADGKKGYYFYAPVFSAFLFIRTCLIPILKKITIERGGFILIGSAFAARATAFILSGKPGSGKTKLMLDKLEAGGEFLGDSELILTADKKILPVFPYVEARLKTLDGTSRWARLSLRNKAYLWFCHLLSGLSLRRISFNLLLDSVDNPWIAQKTAAGSFSRYCLLQLNPETEGIKTLSVQEFIRSVEDYEAGYQRSFGQGIYTPQLRELGLNQLRHLLSGASSLWQCAAGKTACDFLTREMNR